MSEYSKTAGYGASGSTVVTIGAVASTMSAAEMTATLATIGSAVGGGMAAGIAVVGAAPIVIGVAVSSLFDLFD